MRFGIFMEHQLPRPWNDGDEYRLFQEALEQVELADQLGIDYAWEVEHHFLEEYSHSAAPEVFLGACTQRTKNIRLGHGIIQMPPKFNHPARVAERIATLDQLSGGRVDFGTGESASAIELAGFNVPRAEKKKAWAEGLEQCANMMAMDPYPGFEGEYFSMPCRNVVPKPFQRPHPPLWVACSTRDAIRAAARLGLGALTFAFVDSSEAKLWVDDYYRIIEEECTPIGHAVNANLAVVTSFGLHPDEQEAMRRGLDGFRFYTYGLGQYYFSGNHVPGRSDLWAQFAESPPPDMDEFLGKGGIGTPEQMTEHLREFEEAGVDQVVFIQQGGRTKHEHICESLELFASDVMPTFKVHEAEQDARKAEQLAPFIAEALARKNYMQQLADDEIPPVKAEGRSVSEDKLPEAVPEPVVTWVDDASPVRSGS